MKVLMRCWDEFAMWCVVFWPERRKGIDLKLQMQVGLRARRDQMTGWGGSSNFDLPSGNFVLTFPHRRTLGREFLQEGRGWVGFKSKVIN